MPPGCSKIQMKGWKKNLGNSSATLHDVLIFICSTSRTFFLPGKNQEAADGESVILIRGNFVLQIEKTEHFDFSKACLVFLASLQYQYSDSASIVFSRARARKRKAALTS